MSKTVVILGASFAGIPIAHHLLAHTAPLVPDLKVILVSPNTHLLWAHATVRAIVPGKIGEEKVFLPIAPAFEKYPSDKFELVLGTAEVLDPQAKSVLIKTNGDEKKRVIDYHTLVIATGSSAQEGMPFKTIRSTERTRDELHAWQQKIEAAKSIVVAGAGITGVEVAGELAESYGKTKQKTITLVVSGELPLGDEVRKDIRQLVRADLEKLGVRVVVNAKVTKIEGPESGPKTVQLSLPGGKTDTIETDVIIPTYGLVPNSSFIPEAMKDQRGFVKQTNHLRAEGHDDIFVIGDVGNLETPQSLHTENQLMHIVKNLQAHLRGENVTEYKFSTDPFFSLSIGPGGGTGQIKGWRVPSFLVKMLKAKTLGTQNGADYVAGKRTIMSSKWA